jgi:hypothetical protein
MSAKWIRDRKRRSEWGRKLARKRWDDHNARIDEMIRTGELPPPPPEWPSDQPYYTITVEHHPTGRRHEFGLYRATAGRRDQFRIVQDSRPWKAAMGLTRFFRGLAAAMFGEHSERRAAD